MSHKATKAPKQTHSDQNSAAVHLFRADSQSQSEEQVCEIGGPVGLEPTRYGDWEKKGRCIDF